MPHYALLVIGMQNGMIKPKSYPGDDLIGNINSLSEAFRSKGREVVFVRHIDSEMLKGSHAYQIARDIVVEKGDLVIDSYHLSAFCDTGLKEFLEGAKASGVFCCGLATQSQVNATCVAAYEHGFEVIVPGMCNGAYSYGQMSAKDIYRLFNESVWPNGIASSPSAIDAIGMV